MTANRTFAARFRRVLAAVLMLGIVPAAPAQAQVSAVLCALGMPGCGPNDAEVLAFLSSYQLEATISSLKTSRSIFGRPEDKYPRYRIDFTAQVAFKQDMGTSIDGFELAKTCGLEFSSDDPVVTAYKLAVPKGKTAVAQGDLAANYETGKWEFGAVLWTTEPSSLYPIPPGGIVMGQPSGEAFCADLRKRRG